MAFQGWDPRMMQETLRQGFLDRQEIMNRQRANDAQDLHNAVIAQQASKEGLFDNNPGMQQALGISKTPYLDPRDLGYNPAGTFGAPQPQQQSNGMLGQATPQSDNPVPKMVGGYKFPAQEQQDAPQMPSPGPYASGYVNAPSPRPATTGMDQPGPWAPTVDPASIAANATAPVSPPKSFTKQTLEKLNELFPGQVDVASGTMNASLRDMIEKNQAQQAQLQSLMLQNQYKYGTQLTIEQEKADLARRLDEANNQTKRAIGQGHDTARVTAAQLAAGRARAAATKGSISGGKDVIADNLWKSADDNVKGIQKNPGGALLGQDTINAYKADQAYIEGEVAAGRKVDPGSLPSRRGAGMASPPPGNPAPGVNAAPPKGKTVSKATYFKNTDTTHIIYSDGSTADVKGRPSGSP